MTDIAQPLHKEGEVCSECGSDGGTHFGSCSKHWLNLRKEEIPGPVIITSLGNGGLGKPSVNWIAGAEMKVTEDFLKEAITSLTGAEVESIKYKGKAFVVRFK